jgi:hypothetical protein
MGYGYAEKAYDHVRAHYRENLEGAKFVMGEAVVLLEPDSVDKTNYRGTEGTVIGIRWANDEFEYALDTVDFLIWEHELEKR